MSQFAPICQREACLIIILQSKMYQINKLCTLNLYIVMCQLLLNKAGPKKKKETCPLTAPKISFLLLKVKRQGQEKQHN